MTFADSKQRFSSRVADYVRYRPSYPSALLDLLRSECALRSGHVIADIGSGTGFLSELFLKNGNRVYGIEPNISPPTMVSPVSKAPRKPPHLAIRASTSSPPASPFTGSNQTPLVASSCVSLSPADGW
jgi:SAM-dependent methyltransferase